MIRRLLAGLAFAAVTALAAGPAAAQEMKEINFGIISTESSQNLKQDWQPLLDDMARKTGLKVNAFFSPDYAGIIEGMRFNKVHVAWFGNKSAMEAVDRASAEVFAQMVNADGSQGYNSVLLVHRDSPIKSVEDMLKNAKSLSFGNGDPNSTSGFLVPSYYVFAMNNVDPKSIFRVVRSANHETNALAVANKQVDVATNNTENLEKIQERFPDKFKEMRVIWTSPLIPLDPLVMRKDLPEAAKAKIKTFFYTYGQGGQKEKDNLMKLSKLSMFKESSNRQLIPIRQLELFREKTKLEADTAMAPADRQAKLSEVNRKLADLNQQLAQK
jgi:phosphonate transport system substrate-binding protein